MTLWLALSEMFPVKTRKSEFGFSLLSQQSVLLAILMRYFFYFYRFTQNLSTFRRDMVNLPKSNANLTGV